MSAPARPTSRLWLSRPKARKEGADMWIIGVDYHPSVQQIAFVNTDTGECGERRLSHSEGEAEKFYRELKAEGCSVRVGMEATGHSATRGSALSSQAPGYGVRGNQGREAVTRTCSVRMQ